MRAETRLPRGPGGGSSNSVGEPANSLRLDPLPVYLLTTRTTARHPSNTSTICYDGAVNCVTTSRAKSQEPGQYRVR